MASNLTTSSWAPPGEDGLDLLIERIQLAGSEVGGVAYGVFLTMWFTCVYYQFKGKTIRTLPFGIMAYLFALLTFVTTFYVSNTRWVQQMFIDYRNFHFAPNSTAGYDPTDPTQSGPLGFYNLVYNTPMIILGNTSYAIVQFLADALVLYRCYLIWNFNHVVMIFPALLFLASTSMSILTVWNNSISTQQFVGATAVAFVLSWTIMSLCLNIILTAMIVGRLLAARNRLIHVLGRQHARLYTSIAAMVIESAALTAIFSFLFIIFFRQTGPAEQFINILLPLITYAAATAPTLILLRVARGRAFTKATNSATSTGIAIGPGPGKKSTPMVTLNSTKGSNTQIDEGGVGVWPLGIEKREESVSSYV